MTGGRGEAPDQDRGGFMRRLVTMWRKLREGFCLDVVGSPDSWAAGSSGPIKGETGPTGTLLEKGDGKTDKAGG